ncbi:MAG: glycosyltransferase, partial [Candidatus Aenigmatarchaeota archaeon]
MEVSVVIPTYNEAENIEALINEVANELGDRDFEIIIVDDNSPDNTAEIVKELQEDFEGLKLIEREGKSGIGSAYKEGFQEASGDFIVQMDADFSHPPRYITDLLKGLEDSDVAVGSRYVEGGERRDPLHRRIFPLIGSYLYRYGLGFPVRDFTSGFKAYRSEVMNIFTDDLPDGFHFQAASLLKIVDNDYSVTEVPIEFEERRAGKPKYDQMDLVKNGLFFGKTFLKKNHRPLKFGAVGVSGVAVDMGILYALTQFGGLNQV